MLDMRSQAESNRIKEGRARLDLVSLSPDEFSAAGAPEEIDAFLSRFGQNLIPAAVDWIGNHKPASSPHRSSRLHHSFPRSEPLRNITGLMAFSWKISEIVSQINDHMIHLFNSFDSVLLARGQLL